MGTEELYRVQPFIQALGLIRTVGCLLRALVIISKEIWDYYFLSGNVQILSFFVLCV